MEAVSITTLAPGKNRAHIKSTTAGNIGAAIVPRPLRSRGHSACGKMPFDSRAPTVDQDTRALGES